MYSDKWFPRKGEFYFNDDLKRGYVVQDEKGKLLVKNMSAIPQLVPDSKSYTTKQYFDYFAEMYHDDFGQLIFFYLLGMIYAGRFRHNMHFKFPYLVFNGLR